MRTFANNGGAIYTKIRLFAAVNKRLYTKTHKNAQALSSTQTFTRSHSNSRYERLRVPASMALDEKQVLEDTTEPQQSERARTNSQEVAGPVSAVL